MEIGFDIKNKEFLVFVVSAVASSNFFSSDYLSDLVSKPNETGSVDLSDLRIKIDNEAKQGGGKIKFTKYYFQ